jgi:hypothetical protein
MPMSAAAPPTAPPMIAPMWLWPEPPAAGLVELGDGVLVAGIERVAVRGVAELVALK